MFDLKRRLDRVRPEFPNNIDILDASGYIQCLMEIVQHVITEVIALVLLRLIIPRYPDIAFRKLTEANQSPLHFVMRSRYAFDVFVDACADRCIPGRDGYQFLSPLKRFQYTEDVAIVLRESHYSILVDHRKSLRAVMGLVAKQWV